MLTDAETLLITLAVDGEATPEQAKALRRLLAARPEAARLLEQMTADAAQLKALPRVRTPHGLATAVLARVTSASSPPRRTSRASAWLPYATAASLLFAFTAGSYWFFRQPADPDFARRTQLPITGADQLQPVAAQPSAFAKRGSLPTVVEAKAGPGDDFNVLVKAGPDATPAGIVSAPPTSTVGSPPRVFGAGPAEQTKPFLEVDLKLPVLLAATEFHQKPARDQLVKELAAAPAFRLDLFSENPVGTITALQVVARAAQVNVVVEATAAELLKKPNGWTFAVYLENLTPTELAGLLAGVSRIAAQKPEQALNTAHLMPATAADQKEIKDLLGVEITVSKPAAKPDEPKPVSADTITKVTAGVKKPGEKAAVVLTFLPTGLRANPAKSAEVKQFLEHRGDRKPGTTPLLIVVR